ncbi:uncharacterized protein LOC131996978 [Stomoxys calcitrans]|uniref:uncharacterized protein LOC131996978 n=1 Tax=Stomoxys calcitrans TaxID=35570 RepID=UPI0027E365F4|nr:uncharacterized protein LOC131996978 [Stomoxys calcitrans]
MEPSNQANSATGSSAVKPSPIHEKFLFDCDHLISFCTAFEKVDVTDQTDSLLEVKLDDLEVRWKKLQIDYESLMLSPETTNTKDFKENAKVNFNVTSEAYYETRSQIVDILKISGGADSRTMSTRNSLAPQHLFQTSSSAHVSDTYSSCIKVPPCDTEVFKGSYEEWPSFRDMFTAVYVNHPKLTRAQKLYHLRNKTKGSAGAIVKRYTLCDDNFDLAWGALRTRYENKRVLVDHQLRILFEIPVATDENSESLQRIHSTVSDCLCTLKSLQVQVECWDPILIYLVSTKLPNETISLWEQSLKSHRELPSWSQMDEFLLNRFEVVERISSIKSTKDRHSLPSVSYSKSNEKIQMYTSQEKLTTSCTLCKENHSIRTRPDFRKFKPQERIDFVFKNKICNNCLSEAHMKQKCRSKNTCLSCRKHHHTLLHLDQPPIRKSESGSQTFSPKQQISANSISSERHEDISQSSSAESYSQVQANFSSNSETILLRTALVQVEHNGELFTIRALIDPGSQRTFLSERVRNMLQVSYRKSSFEIFGIGCKTQKAHKECELVLFSRRYNTRCRVNAIVLPKVTQKLPAVSFEIPNSPELRDLDLADPNFNKSSNIDLVLGNDAERFINLEGVKKNICGLASAYNTIFGWVLSGPMQGEKIQAFTTNVIPTEDENLSEILRKFWEIEEIPSISPRTESEIICEEFYLKTTTRLPNGRYVVRLPFKEEFPNSIFLGSSRFLALGQYTRMEKTLIKDAELRGEYRSVLKEYISLGHMEETSSLELGSEGKFNSFYLPHHAVVRPDHKSTKVRVVFNASRKTKSDYSLNDVLHTGPTLQNDLISIILNWRKYKYVFCGDIQKMYRQILVHPQDRAYQRILFQNQSAEPIRDYHLNTVTFGINCAPFLAIRTLLQLASDSETEFPKVASILRKETYVDDILSGGFTIEETIEARNDLIAVLKSAGFPLKKITANAPELLSHLPPEDLYDMDLLKLYESSSTKTLGIKWNALTDCFSYASIPIEKKSQATKRQVLSTVAKLFDPAGWITPVIIRSKILMQQLWLEGSNWDETISPDSLDTWNNLIDDLAHVEDVIIPRWIKYLPTDLIQIHGFCDASKMAYCATVYVRCQTTTSVVISNLLMAKSKVAPIKTVSLPKLELNGAVLLAKLVRYILNTFEMNFGSVSLWTDSSIVLGWLSKPPMLWETYVANRASQIHELVPDAKWNYVSTHDNPADIGTRGCRPQDLKISTLWWNGPPWLTNPEGTWPKKNPLVPLKEHDVVQMHHVAAENNDILLRFSSYTRALRVISYIFRFFHNSMPGNTRKYESYDLSMQEMQFVKFRLISLAQRQYFSLEYELLLNSKPLPNKSVLSTLNPFLDSNQVLRVNGRLSDSFLPYRERHPIILPGNSRLCHLYLLHLHSFLVHAECNQMCRFVQTEFYVSRLKPRVKSIIYNCKVCVLYKQKQNTQIMAPLPLERCTLSPPFHTTGIDFAGPFELKSSSLRRAPTIKGYVCVFACFATRAIHLETCSDLSSAAFEAAFYRFVGRRGLPRRIVSDNGRNFLGASRALIREFSQFIKSASSDISKKYAAHGFEWGFIPPHAPHMGGLWEAAVKSFKIHFKKIAGAHKFTFEQFQTILARIEGVLNSRPISAMSDDPADLTALTPGHFLKGSPILAFPEPLSPNISLINRWLKLKAIHHQFALRWKEEYLKTLHKRYKWKTKKPNLRVGDLVAIMDDLLPPSEWRLGRIEKTYLGSDNNVRIADVRTATGILNRPIVKLCFLPFENTTESNSN